ncbi:MAG TPA: gamma-glutamyltransferase [Actinomycetes bacterium]|nr:gamma-glutamyltransferase [Actinomycetes bacterium]
MPEVAVASPWRQATEVGLDVGRRGGTAVDAAIATAAMLTVGYPASCGIGGDLLALVREPDGRVTFVNASGRAPFATDADAVRQSHAKMPWVGPHSITVPGVVDGWSALMSHGAALPWADLLAPAQAAAADGVPVAPFVANKIADTVPQLGHFLDLAAFLAPHGTPLTVGETLRNPALTQSLAALIDQGPEALYQGEIGASLCAGLAERGVPITVDDLQAFTVDEAEPLVTEVAGWRLHGGRPNSQAYLVLRLLGMLDRLDETIATTADAPLHRRLSASQLAYAFASASQERDEILSDPETMTVDVESLLLAESLRNFATHVTTPLDGRDASAFASPATGDTIAVVAADSDGRSVSLIQSLFDEFGSLVFEPTTGIVMHNRGACFVLDPASPNVLAPGKRPLHTLSPVLAEAADGSQRLAVGTMGGHAQPQILTQVFSRLFAGESAQAAVSAPRMTVGAWETDETPATVATESDLDPEMLRELTEFPGPHVSVPPHHPRMGHAHAIRVTSGDTAATTRFDVGTDPRADGLPTS